MKKRVLARNEIQKKKREKIITAWNLTAEAFQLQKIKSLSPKNMELLDRRMDEKEFDFGEILRNIQTSRYLQGLETNWIIYFSWIIEKKENYLKIIEGNYNRKKYEISDSEKVKGLKKLTESEALKQNPGVYYLFREHFYPEYKQREEAKKKARENAKQFNQST